MTDLKLRKILQIICGCRRSQFYPFLSCQEMPLEFILGANLIRILKKLKLGKTRRGNLRVWLCTNNLSVLTVFFGIYYTTETQKRLFASVLTNFVVTVKLNSKQWVFTFSFVHVRKQEQVC